MKLADLLDRPIAFPPEACEMTGQHRRRAFLESGKYLLEQANKNGWFFTRQQPIGYEETYLTRFQSRFGAQEIKGIVEEKLRAYRRSFTTRSTRCSAY